MPARTSCAAAKPFVFLNGAQAVQRQRFTLAHELGHHRLGHAAVVDGVEEVEGSSDEPLEQQANAFAGEFLAPDRALHAWMEANDDPRIDLHVLVRLATWFGISAPAAFVRLSQADILRNASQRRDLKRLLDRGAHSGVQRALGLEPVEDSLARLPGRTLTRTCRPPTRQRANRLRRRPHRPRSAGGGSQVGAREGGTARAALGSCPSRRSLIGERHPGVRAGASRRERDRELRRCGEIVRLSSYIGAKAAITLDVEHELLRLSQTSSQA